jgi:NDP-sugar pyrophosphorylase family protein
MSNDILSKCTSGFALRFPDHAKALPWEIIGFISDLLQQQIRQLSSDYSIKNNIAIHRTAVIEEHVILKGPVIIGENCFVAANAYMRGGVFLDESVKVGPGCEIKSSIILQNTALAHFNFVGDSIIGFHVNMEAGSVIANHFNERDNKQIPIRYEGKIHDTGATKFGAVVGDHCRIGANAVLSPGTLLPPKSIVKRLELVEQVPYL